MSRFPIRNAIRSLEVGGVIEILFDDPPTEIKKIRNMAQNVRNFDNMNIELRSAYDCNENLIGAYIKRIPDDHKNDWLGRN